jgi:O-6-methylguanine DNA methyltransferase
MLMKPRSKAKIKQSSKGASKSKRENALAQKWVVVSVDGKVAGISTDYKVLSRVTEYLAEQGILYGEIVAKTVGFDYVWELRGRLCWEDLYIIGSKFQKKVWRTLYDLTHDENGLMGVPRLYSYSDIAQMCDNLPGVRSVAHAIGLNPISVIIPCHLVIPKESKEKIEEIQKNAEVTLFKGDGICFTNSIDFGEYALGKDLKSMIIAQELE